MNKTRPFCGVMITFASQKCSNNNKRLNKMNKILLLTLLITFSINESLKAQFTLSGEIRPRSEYRHGYKTVPDTDAEAAFFTDQRTRLNFDFKSEKVNYFLSLQDIRVWGNQAQLVIGDGYLTGIHEAWAEVKLSDALNMKLGRQEIILDDHRIFGSVAWAQQARSHDAALFSFSKDALTIKAALAYNQATAGNFGTYYNITGNYKAMQFLHANYKLDAVNISALFLNNGLQGTNKTFFSQTFGTRVSLNNENIIANLNAYYQGGLTPDNNFFQPDSTIVKAHLINLEAGYKFGKHSVLAGYEIISGNDELNPVADETHAFSPFFGTNHKFNGHMDYFYVGNHANTVGLRDLYLTYKGALNDNFGIVATYHLFDNDADLDDPGNPGNAFEGNLGSEIDLMANYKLNKDVTFTAGYSHFLTTDGTVALKGGDIDETNNWAWLQITIKPVLFTSKTDE